MQTLEQIRALVSEDMCAVNALIIKNLDSRITLIQALGEHILNSGGKRLRPLLALLSARCFDITTDSHIHLAAIVEFIHTATLLHDDVVDASQLRRGHETANAIWGNEASVLVGDFLFSRAFQMMVHINRLKIMAILAETSNTIAAGEVQQLLNCRDPTTDEAAYMRVIEAKTAKLFAAATQLGAHLTDQPESIENAMAAYGLHLGNAFQLIDDALDYSGDSEKMGKNIGDDLAEGKPTLPLIYAMRQSDTYEKNLISEAIREGQIERLKDIQSIIASTGAIEYTYSAAKREATAAIEALSEIPDSIYKSALIDLAHFTLSRDR